MASFPSDICGHYITKYHLMLPSCSGTLRHGFHGNERQTDNHLDKKILPCLKELHIDTILLSSLQRSLM